METQHEFMASNDLKGKRRRPSSPHSTAETNTNFMAESEDQYSGSISSPASSSEEEDMAYCLILLAQGHCKPPPHDLDDNCCRVKKISSIGTTNEAGFLVYECKTCNRSFASFQALGGHRASHKKPKSAISDHENKLGLAVPAVSDSQLNEQNLENFAVQMGTDKGNRSKSKIHECSICGSEFSSGQALGGHMRRHRANNNQVIDHQMKPTNLLGLDLNLPVPEESKFQFPPSQQPLAFSTPTLVDCYF